MTGKCAQRFLFEWDEVGSLVRARRWDMALLQDQPSYPAVPNGPPAAEARYRYSAGQRVHKESIQAGASSFTVDVFASLRLKDTDWNSTAGAYRLDASVASVNLGVARVISRPGVPSLGGDQHTLLFVPDHLGSTSTVLDKATSEIAEMVTYLLHGGIETDLWSERWQGLREDLRFTGAREDEEFGLIAMGVRAYSPLLGRFMSADFFIIHGVAGDINPYAYVAGSVLNLTDPSGLDWCIFCTEQPRADGSSNPGSNGPGADAPVQPGGTPGAAPGGGSRGGGFPSGPSVPTPPPPAYVPSAAPATGSFASVMSGLQQARALVLPTLIRLEDSGVLMHSQAAIKGIFHGIPIGILPGQTVGAALDAIGIKTDHRAKSTELVASIVGPIILGGVGAAVERAGIAAGAAVAKGAAAGAATMDTAAIRFTQSSVKGTFADGRTIQGTVDALAGPGGDVVAAQIPPIRIFEGGGALRTLDNRRLLPISEAGRPVPYVWATPAEVAAESWKFTATPQQMGGWFIRVK